MSRPPANRDFRDTKAEGSAVEWLLCDRLTDLGWTVQPNQANWDEAANADGAARAFHRDGSLHLPDLEVIAPYRMAFEVKSKEPRWKDGSIGWDSTSFRHAERWQDRCGVPVVYAIRDRSIAPLPTSRTELDDLEAWYCASLHELRRLEPDRITQSYETRDGDTRDKTTWFWPRDAFWPLADLIEGRFTIASVLLRPKPTFGTSRLL
jgi:hypothetical protein